MADAGAKTEPPRVLLEAALGAAEEAITAKDRAGVYVFANAAAVRLVGRPVAEIVGRRAADLVAPEAARISEAADRAVLESGEAVVEERRVVVGGAERLLRTRRVPWRDAAGAVAGTLAITTDATAESEVARALDAARLARRDAEAAGVAKDRLLSLIAHELKTPLTAMLGWLALVRHGDLEGADLARSLEVIERNARAQARIVEELLDVSRVLGGQVAIDRAPVDLAATLEAALVGVRARADARRIALRAEVGAPGVATGDRDRLRQALEHVLSAAVERTTPGGEVRVRASRDGERARIEVADGGPGLGPDALERVFEPRSDAGARDRWFGLALARRIAELHGGALSASSPGEGEGRGAALALELPLAAARPSGPVRAVSAAPPPACGVPRLDGVRVLYVDDDAEMRELVEAILRHAGAAVELASTAAGALAAVERARPAVLLADVAMPGEDGFALVRSLRARGAGGAIPAVALTAFSRDDDRARAHAAGFDVHLPKPIDADGLVRVLGALVARPESRPAGG